MIPSTRTPEGEPLRCPICGADSSVGVSRPPGDSVCPVCGAHVWIGSTPKNTQQTKFAIRNFISELTTRVADQDFSDDTCRHLVSGLTNSLAAHGAILWSTRAGFLRYFARKPLLKCHFGQMDSPVFAAEIISAKRDIQRYEELDGKSCLLLGVPLINSGRVSGAIEIVQRDVESEAVRRGYMRFLSQIAQIAAPLAT